MRSFFRNLFSDPWQCYSLFHFYTHDHQFRAKFGTQVTLRNVMNAETSNVLKRPRTGNSLRQIVWSFFTHPRQRNVWHTNDSFTSSFGEICWSHVGFVTIPAFFGYLDYVDLNIGAWMISTYELEFSDKNENVHTADTVEVPYIPRIFLTNKSKS